MKKDFGKPHEIYQAISEKAIEYGVFHKCLFHLHTPASHDYRYFKKYDTVDSENFNPKKIQSEVTDSILFDKCVELGVFPSDKREVFFHKTGNIAYF